jgi:hypothetical protein
MTKSHKKTLFKRGDRIEVEWEKNSVIARRLIRANGEILQLPLTLLPQDAGTSH